jgi:hypothetical protein
MLSKLVSCYEYHMVLCQLYLRAFVSFYLEYSLLAFLLMYMFDDNLVEEFIFSFIVNCLYIVTNLDLGKRDFYIVTFQNYGGIMKTE